MVVHINGEAKTYNSNVSVFEILSELGIEQKVMAVALNSKILKKELWQSTMLENNDKLELLQFTGGG